MVYPGNADRSVVVVLTAAKVAANAAERYHEATL